MSTGVQAAPPAVRVVRWDLEILRIVAILGVVAIHVFPLAFMHPRLEGTATWNFAVIIQTVSVRCVPMFILVSGALVLAPRMHQAGPWEFYRRRAARMIPAVIFWHLFYLFVIRVLVRGEDLTAQKVFLNVVDARVYTALYFLWLILGLYLVAPVLASFLAQGGRARAVGTAVVGIGWASLVWSIPMMTGLIGAPRPLSPGMFTWWIFYVGTFVAGWAWRDPRAGQRWMWALPLALALIALQIWQRLNPQDHPWLSALLPVGYISVSTTASTILIFICMVDLYGRYQMPEKWARGLRTVGQATFGLFLCHLAFIAAIREIYPDFYADPRPVAKTAMYAVVVSASLALSLAASRVPFVRRIF